MWNAFAAKNIELAEDIYFGMPDASSKFKIFPFLKKKVKIRI